MVGLPGKPSTSVSVFVMSPNDVQAERDIVDDVVASLDRSLGAAYGMSIKALRWERLTGDVGRSAQELTNEAFLADPGQIFVGIMWKTVGSPSGGTDPSGRPYESGTIEEFHRIVSFKRERGGNWPRILFYRRMKPLPLTTTAQVDEYRRVAEFFEGFKGRGPHPGRYVEYDDEEGFRARLQEDLTTTLTELRENPAEPREGPADTAIPAGWETGYLTELREELERVPIPVPEVGRGYCPLKTVYVDLDLRTGLDRGADAVVWSRLLTPKQVLVSGGPGAGKSTLLRRAALAVTDARLRMLDSGSTGGGGDDLPGATRLPIWVDLTDVAARLTVDGGPQQIAAWQNWLPILATSASLTEPQVRSLLDHGDVVLFLDRLDEVPHAAVRRQMVQAVKVLQRESSPLSAPNHVVVACRTAGVDGMDWGTTFEEFRIAAMNGPTRENLLRAWCEAIWGTRGPDSLGRVTEALRNSPALAGLAANPQVATMLARIAAGDHVPIHRVPLYDQFVQTVLATGRLRHHGDVPALRGHLVALAYGMQISADVGVLGLQEARATLAQRDGGPGLLEDLVLHTGLLAVDRRFGASDFGAKVRFEHRTLQEFLAACHFAGQPAVLLANMLDAAWTETLAMTAGVLALGPPDRLRAFLSEVVGEAVPTPADRVAAASVCLREVGPLGVPDAVLDPARAAQERMLPELRRLEVGSRVAIADGFGSVRDPRLVPEVRWVDVPAGPFVRGSDDPDAWEQEGPVATVAVAGFRIQRWPVTVGEFQLFLTADGYGHPEWWPPDGWLWRRERRAEAPAGWEHQASRSNRPVVGVSWWEATAYCAWLTAEGDLPCGRRADLPTEMQWEKAARGPAAGPMPRRRFPWGDDWTAADFPPANFGHVGAGLCPVGLFGPDESPYGVWDLAGNVAERCRDGFAPYESAPGPDVIGPDVIGPDVIVRADYTHGHAVRGGSWAANPLDLRVTVRFGDPRSARDDRTGFRIVLTGDGAT